MIVLDPGIYTLEYLEAAINAALGVGGVDWWTSDSDPGYSFTYNLVTTKINTYMDSSKLKAPGTQLGIDFDTYRLPTNPLS